jgi:hypothetical protein
MKLSEEQRDAIKQQLNEQQQVFLKDELVRGRRTIFANRLAIQKGSVVPEGSRYEDLEHLVDSWIYTDYIDAGHVTNALQCECGRSLRYQHIVQHKISGEIKRFGIDHLQLHTGIDAATVSDILSGFSRIDLELDELLQKVEAGWTPKHATLPPLDEARIPPDIARHLDLRLPLLDRQITRYRKIYNESLILRAQSQVRIAEDRLQTMTDNFKIGVLFDMPGDKPEARHSNIPLELSQELQHLVLKLLQEDIQSIRVLCEAIIRERPALNERYLSGKPRIYYSVCRFADRLVQEKAARLVFSDLADRNYEWVEGR